jgi:transposase-like protein
MPQGNAPRRVKSHQQIIQALELRTAGASFRQIGEALSVSKPRAFRIVRKALDELV